MKETVEQFKRTGGQVTYLPAQVALRPVLRTSGWEASDLPERLRDALLDASTLEWDDLVVLGRQAR